MKNYINNLIELTENKKDELLIVVIGNVKGFTKIDDDYTDTSIISEYYSQQQFDDIVIALRSNKFIVKCYFDELDFIHDLTDNNVFVYNEKSDKKVRQIANKYKTDVVVQKFISGFEVEVPFILTNECHVYRKPIFL